MNFPASKPSMPTKGKHPGLPISYYQLPKWCPNDAPRDDPGDALCDFSGDTTSDALTDAPSNNKYPTGCGS